MARLRAYVDESKFKTYTMPVVLCELKNIPGMQRLMRETELPGQRRTHMRKESPRRQKLIFDRVTKSAKLEFFFVTSQEKSDVIARADCLRVIIRECIALGVEELVLELDASFVAQDRKVISTALEADNNLIYRHEAPHVEPLLWAADTAAWGKSRGWI